MKFVDTLICLYSSRSAAIRTEAALICWYVALRLTLATSNISSLLCWQQSPFSVAALIKSTVKQLLVFQSSATAAIALSCFRHIRRAAKCCRFLRGSNLREGKRLWMRSFQELGATIKPDVHDVVIKRFNHRSRFNVSNKFWKETSAVSKGGKKGDWEIVSKAPGIISRRHQHVL